MTLFGWILGMGAMCLIAVGCMRIAFSRKHTLSSADLNDLIATISEHELIFGAIDIIFGFLFVLIAGWLL